MSVAAKHWTADELERLATLYRRGVLHGDLRLKRFAKSVGRLKSNVCRKARELGLTRQRRPRAASPRLPLRMFESVEERRAHSAAAVSAAFRRNGHPRGALGLKHTEAARRLMGEASKRAAKARTPEQWTVRSAKICATRIARYGTGNPATLTPTSMYSRARRGKRADLDGQFFRSSWEANYARYLRYLRERGQIASWAYEPKRFVFPGVTSGALTYLPDFEVVDCHGDASYHEVKGWMDPRSKDRLSRMAEFYPNVRVVVIGVQQYRAIALAVSRQIPEWEDESRISAE